MGNYYSPKNYYNENGVLMLAKGTPITTEILGKLERYQGFDPAGGSTGPESEKERDIVQNQNLRGRFSEINALAVNQASDMLIRIIFESKQKSWWMYVNALSNYIDWIYTHSIDVAMISLMIAQQLRYPEKVLWELGLGAFLHDVGKLLIPKQILQKKTPLTQADRMILNQHCELGIATISGCSLSEIVTGIIIQHHERMDGSGYPQKLKEDQISEYAKIVMIADSFDAITAARPYRKAKGPKEAFQILNNQKDQYSKECLTALEAILE